MYRYRICSGTGKTLLALASALEQRSDFKQIYLARPIVPLSNRDIGYLPGDANQKIDPYMQPLWDNLSFIKNQFKETSKQHKKIDEMVQTEKITNRTVSLLLEVVVYQMLFSS